MSRFQALLCLPFICSTAIAEECSGEQCATASSGLTLLQNTRSTTKVAGGSDCIDYTKQYNDADKKRMKNGEPFGSTDKDGDPCSYYSGKAAGECGDHDDEDFIANEMCCSCGGGSVFKESRSFTVNKASVFLSRELECPGDSKPITSITACRAAMDVVGLFGDQYKGADAEADWPKGCYLCSGTNNCGDGVWFNKHGTGAPVDGTQRFCATENYVLDDVRVLFVGDSDIDYWDSGVAFPGSFNVGVGGYTTQDVNKEVDQWVKELDPNWVVIVCGENDINKKRWVTEAALKRFKSIVGKFIDDGANVIYLGTKPEPGSKKLYPEYTFYDQQLRKYASQLGGKFQMIDVFKSFSSEKELYNTDKLHMSRLGYKLWNGWVKLAMTSTTPCVLWRDGVCMEAAVSK